MAIRPDVFIATPSHSGDVCTAYCLSLLQTTALLSVNGLSVCPTFMNHCAMIDIARASLAQDFIDSGAEHLLFIDGDQGWDASGALEVIKSPHDFVGGVPPAKSPKGDHLFPVRNMRESGSQKLLEAGAIGTGFLRIRRKALLKMQKAYPETKGKYRGRELHLLFANIIDDEGDALGEDHSFCHRWKKIGGKIFVYPNIRFSHFGRKEWTGNMLTDDPRLKIVN